MVRRDPSAWQTFMHEYHSLICRRIEQTARECRFVLCKPEVEDICSDVFKALVANDLASLRAFQGSSRLSTWLTVVVRRTCLKALNKRKPDRGDGGEQGSATFGFQCEDAIGSLIRQEEFRSLENSMSELKPSDQKVLALFFYEELKYEQIAERMNISINAVGPKLFRAQQLFKKLVRSQNHA